MAAKKDRIKGKGWFVEGGYIYVQGSIRGKFRKKSTRLPYTKNNIKYVERNSAALLEELCYPKQQCVEMDLASWAREVVAAGAKRPGKRGGRGETDQRTAMSRLERHILPHWRGYALEDIRARDIELWQDRLLESGLSSSSVAKCRNLLRQILHKAVANDMIPKNPVEYAEGIAISHEKIEGYSAEEAKRMIAESTGWIHRYLLLAFTTGMRTGEQMALRWEDIDFGMGCILLQRSVTKGRLTEGSNGNKNHNRIVPLLPAVLEMLREEKMRAVSEWMFPSRTGRYYSESKAIVKAHFRPLLDRLDIEYRSLRVTRHTFATLADGQMVQSPILDEMVGNSEAVRQKHYTTKRPTQEKIRAAQEALTGVAEQLGTGI